MVKHTGTVIQVVGPVLDIRFPDGQLPLLLSAIEIPVGDHTIVAEVAQHIGDNVVRCIAMSSTDGLCRGVEAINTGAAISVLNETGRLKLEHIMMPGLLFLIPGSGLLAYAVQLWRWKR